MKSKIIIGTWPLSGDYGNVSLENIQKSLEFCYNNGFDEYDTAPNYGNGFMEFCLGNVFQDKVDIKINTKIGNFPFGGKSFELEKLKKSFNESLKRLKRKSLTTLFLHNPRNEISEYDKILEYMESLKKENTIEFIGLSKAKGFDYTDVDLNRFDVIQDDVNLLYLDSIKKEKSKKSIFMARSPLASGLLSGNITKNTKFSSDDQRHSWLKEERLESLLRRVEAIKKELDIDVLTLAMKFVLSHEKIDRVICGIKKIEHVEKILEVIDDYKLADKEMNKIKELYDKDFGLRNEKHNAY